MITDAEVDAAIATYAREIYRQNMPYLSTRIDTMTDEYWTQDREYMRGPMRAAITAALKAKEKRP